MSDSALPTSNCTCLCGSNPLYLPTIPVRGQAGPQWRRVSVRCVKGQKSKRETRHIRRVSRLFTICVSSTTGKRHYSPSYRKTPEFSPLH